MKAHKFLVHAGLNPNDSFVELDGNRLQHVTRVEFKLAQHGGLTEILLAVKGYAEVTGQFDEKELFVMHGQRPEPAGLRARIRTAVTKTMADESPVKRDRIIEEILFGLEVAG